MILFKGKFSRIITFLVFGIVIIILAFFVYRERLEIFSFPWQITIINLLAASFFHSVALGVTFFVWSIMLYRFSGFNNYWDNFKIYYLSSLAKRVPTSLPYIGSRISLYAEKNVPLPIVFNCIALENILFTISGITFFFSLLPFYSSLDKRIVAPISITGIILIAIILTRPRIFLEVTNWILRKFKRDVIQFTIKRKDLLLWIGIYLFSWIFAGISFRFLLTSLGKFEYPPFVDTLGISSVFTLVGLISMVFPGGFGMKEIAAGMMLTPWIPFSTGLIIIIANRFMQTVDDLIWSLLALIVSFVKTTPKIKTNKSDIDNTK